MTIAAIPKPNGRTIPRPVWEKIKIPHEVFKAVDEASPFKAITFLEFTERIKYIKDKIAQVSQRPDHAFSETEAFSLLSKHIQRTLPILNDRKDFLIQNGLIRDDIEFEEVRKMILEIMDRPSIKTRTFFPTFRDNYKNLTTDRQLRYGFEHIETIKHEPAIPNKEEASDISKTQEKNAKQSRENAIAATQQPPSGQIIADFKVTENPQNGTKVKFTNTSSNADRFSWRITDSQGNIITTIVGRRELDNFEFPSEGSYYVTLLSSDGTATAKVTKLVTISLSDKTGIPSVQSKPTAQLIEPQPTITAAIPDDNIDTLLTPEYIASLNPFQRQDLIQKAVKAGKYDPLLFRDEKVFQRLSPFGKLDYTQDLVKQRDRINTPTSDTLVSQSTLSAEPPVDIDIPTETPRGRFNFIKSTDEETLIDLEKLSPLGRRAIWGMLDSTQRKHLLDHPYKAEWQGKFDNLVYNKLFNNLEILRGKVDEGIGFKGFRSQIGQRIAIFKQNRKDQISNSAKKGNLAAKWIERKYLAYKRDKNNKQSLIKIIGFMGKELIKSMLSPITNAYDAVIKTKFVNSIIKVIQGTNNFAGRTLGTIGRIGGGIGNSLKFALLPTLISSLMGLNPLLAAGIFSAIGLAGQAFKGIDLLKNPAGFKLPFIDNSLRRIRVFHELALNPHKYANTELVKFSKPFREFVNEFRTSPDLAKTGKLFSAAKHIFKSIPLGAVATGAGFLLTGNLPLSLAIGGITMGAKAGMSYGIERLSMVMGRGLVGNQLFRHLFKFPGMSFLDAAEGAQWIHRETDFIGKRGWGEWLNTQNDSVMKLGPINITRGMSNAVMLGRTILGGMGITRFFANMPGLAMSGTPGMLGSLLSKIPILTRFAAPVAILGYLGLVATGLASFSWATFLGITLGAVAGSLTFALLASTGIGALVGLPVATAVGYIADKFGRWVGSFFDKTAEVLNDLNIVGLIPIIQLGKALYDIVNSTIEDLSDYARIGLISLSIVPALGILIQLSQDQASANFETQKNSVSTNTMNFTTFSSEEYELKLDIYEYDCKISNAQLFYSDFEFIPNDIFSLMQDNMTVYNVKGKSKDGETIIYRNLKKINPAIKPETKVNTGEIIGNC